MGMGSVKGGSWVCGMMRIKGTIGESLCGPLSSFLGRYVGGTVAYRYLFDGRGESGAG